MVTLNWIVGLACVVTTATLAASDAMAGQYAHPGAGCVGVNGSETAVTRREGGIEWASGGDIQVVCPIISKLSEPRPSSIGVNVFSPVINGVVCSAIGLDSVGNFVWWPGVQNSTATGNVWIMTSGPPAPASAGYFALHCWLAPHSGITGYIAYQ